MGSRKSQLKPLRDHFIACRSSAADPELHEHQLLSPGGTAESSFSADITRT